MLKRSPTTWNLAERSPILFGKDMPLADLLRRAKSRLSHEQDTEEALVAAARQGSREAFDALARQHEPMLRHFLIRRVGSEAAEDVLQETWLAGWLALPRYARRSRFKAWLYGIAVHKCTDHFRSRGQRSLETSFEDVAEPAAREDGYAAVELRQAVQTVLALLPAEQREVLELYYYAELTLAEVASVLERNLNTVKYQFYRAHAQVARQIDPTLAVVSPQDARKGSGNTP